MLLLPSQELSGDASDPTAKDALVQAALAKFRGAIRLQPDFDRGAYNLGTTYYTYASSLQGHYASQRSNVTSAVASSSDPAAEQQRTTQDAVVNGYFAIAAQYICLAHALQPQKDVYRKSLSIVKQMLALPFLRVGYLLAPAADTIGTINETWIKQWFVLDHSSFRTASPVEISLSQAGSGVLTQASQMQQSAAGGPHEAPLVLPLRDVMSVRRCNDPSLPAGEAFWICLQQMRQGIYFVAEGAESADAWVDALLLSHHLVNSRGTAALAEALLPQQQAAQQQQGQAGGQQLPLRRPSKNA